MDRAPLADFLRARPRRRTGGLRREEVAGHSAPRRQLREDHVSPTMMRIVERLADTPVLVMSRFNETLLQNQPAVALLGDYTRYTGMSRYLKLTDPESDLLAPLVPRSATDTVRV